MKKRICLWCKKEIINPESRRLYHRDCRKEYLREYQKGTRKKWYELHKEEKKEYSRKNGREDYYKHIENVFAAS